MEHGPTTWLLQLPLLSHAPEHVHINGAIVVFLGILVFSVIANLAIKKSGEKMLIPSKKFSISTIGDLLIDGLYNMLTGVLGHHGEDHFSMIGAIFIFVWFSNLIGLLPLSSSPSSDVTTTFALGIISFVYYNLMGIK